MKNKKLIQRSNTFKPWILRILMHAFQDNSEASAKKLTRYLNNICTKAAAEDQLKVAVASGIFIQTKTKHLRLPARLEEAPTTSRHDLYCYECHLPENVSHCAKCIRSFHSTCRRKKPERPNYTIPSYRLQKNKFPDFNWDSSDDINEDNTNTTQATVSLQADASTENPASSSIVVEENNYLSDNISLTGHEWTPKYDIYDDQTYDNDFETKDVIYVSEVPAPRRRYDPHNNNNNSYKCETIDDHSDDGFSDLELCTACRLLKCAKNSTPPKCARNELNHLINLTFCDNSSWLVTDVMRYIRDSGWSSHIVALVKHLLFKCGVLALSDIAKRISINGYTFLTEFLVDLLDLQHNIGVFFGEESAEYNATKWMMRDMQHDLTEIRLCPDCFRYSHENNQPYWFSKPCFTRHELVFAKVRGFPFWPAKVIRVHAKTGMYDVRFFGDKHTRALISARDIKPIDTDAATLKLPRSTKLAEALRELSNLQHLLLYPFSYFDFNSSPEMLNSAINSLSPNLLTTEATTPVARNSKKRSYNDLGNFSPEVVLKRTTEDPTRKRMLRDISSETALPTIVNASIEKNSPAKNMNAMRATRSAEAARTYTWEEYKEMQNSLEQTRRELEAKKHAYEKQQITIRKLKEKISHYEKEMPHIKRKQWCCKCMKEAKFNCCFNASYCSKGCQQADWYNKHRMLCQKHAN